MGTACDWEQEVRASCCWICGEYIVHQKAPHRHTSWVSRRHRLLWVEEWQEWAARYPGPGEMAVEADQLQSRRKLDANASVGDC